MNEAVAFARLVDALRPWLDHLTIVGGWAHRLYRHTDVAAVPYGPVQTLDVDVAFALDAPLGGSIGDALAAAEFHEQLSGDHTPPVSHYTLASEGFYAEFLAPLQGSGMKRSGKPDATVARAGVTAQKLRHLDLLLLAPLSVRIGEEAGFPLPSPAAVRVPNPVSFIAQKLLIQHDRLPEKRPQDLLYIHDTLELFARRLPELGTLWTGTLRPMLARTVAQRIEQRAAEDFRSLSHEMESAARIPVDRVIRPERLRATCAYGLSVIFAR